MLGNNISTVSWPACGEIDIMEYLGHQQSTVYGTVHYDQSGHKYTGNSYMLNSESFAD
ncbi:MAG: family 16 glycosylhydrolase [Bacteroidales bacterium]|nr:family 16 glycosylhydrolase [Bacteroidales bacterium]